MARTVGAIGKVEKTLTDANYRKWNEFGLVRGEKRQ